MQSETDDFTLEMLGVQSFILALTGLEAFINTYFLQRANETNNLALESKINLVKGNVGERLKKMPKLSSDRPLVEQSRLINELKTLSELRNAIVHPRWNPSSVSFQSQLPIQIHGLVINIRGVLRDQEFCESAFWKTILPIARIAEQREIEQIQEFLFHWTGLVGCSLSDVLAGAGWSHGPGHPSP